MIASDSAHIIMGLDWSYDMTVKVGINEDLETVYHVWRGFWTVSLTDLRWLYGFVRHSGLN